MVVDRFHALSVTPHPDIRVRVKPQTDTMHCMSDAPDPIEPTDAHTRLEAGDAVLIDVRDASAHAEGHAAGARSIPIDQLADHADELKGTTVYTSCGGGTRGPKAAALLRELGVDARVVRGGLRGWKSAGLPVEE